MWTKRFWKVVAERVIRGAVAGVSAVWLAGDVVFDVTNVNSWQDIGSAAVGGAFSALILSLGGNAVTKNGPAFTRNEQIMPPVETPPPAPAN